VDVKQVPVFQNHNKE